MPPWDTDHLEKTALLLNTKYKIKITIVNNQKKKRKKDSKYPGKIEGKEGKKEKQHFNNVLTPTQN